MSIVPDRVQPQAPVNFYTFSCVGISSFYCVGLSRSKDSHIGMTGCKNGHHPALSATLKQDAPDSTSSYQGRQWLACASSPD
ncbi:hypothetical protein X797_009358 [Metarhizium robertsii]|uniref:Uncharacterized protein n=1 Tax=Metarhizium robertsii TaxID=568076 RepID=A0A014N9N2_9HYPO|nr:hypothetical protein X797_009358 [Metarhizium robertsii]